MKPSKSDWILLILKKKSLDRIHIMKSLFLIWNRSKRKIENYFQFKPYLYGPYSLEVYSELRNLKEQGFIIQPPHYIQDWANYHLTKKGHNKAKDTERKFQQNTVGLVESIVKEVSNLDFYSLLQKVYKEAPDFASNSILKNVINK
jgi:uncharacterized protein YwgA